MLMVSHTYTVHDSYWKQAVYLNTSNHPTPLDSKVAIQDRTCTKYGLNLYDGSTWQIALSLEGELELPILYENQVLYQSSTGALSTVGGLANIRADTSDYYYGANQVSGPSLDLILSPGNWSSNGAPLYRPGAFFYRMISNDYLLNDPLVGKYAYSFRVPFPDEKGPSWDNAGAIHWNDWKPITGENSWAAIIGPIQSLYLRGNSSIPLFDTIEDAPEPIKLALSVLPAFKVMQSVEGSLYHCPKGTDMFPSDESEATNVSNENNLSAYSALRMLLWVLQNNTNSPDTTLSNAIADITKLKTGLESWFKTHGLSPPLAGTGNRVFYQGGHVNFTGGFSPLDIDKDPQGFAVDCQTWGGAVLGVDFIDSIGGDGTAYGMWEETKHRAGYFDQSGNIKGIGYTTHSDHDVWSSEWTFGAIAMTRRLAKEYKTAHPDWSAVLASDADAMESALLVTEDQGGLLSLDGGYLYANKRYFIPWGWYANAVPSLCSTSWAVMNKYHFNPFILGGGVY